MTGPSGSPDGFPLSHFAAEMKGKDVGSLPPFELSEGLTMLGAVWLRIEAGKRRRSDASASWYLYPNCRQPTHVVVIANLGQERNSDRCQAEGLPSERPSFSGSNLLRISSLRHRATSSFSA